MGHDQLLKHRNRNTYVNYVVDTHWCLKVAVQEHEEAVEEHKAAGYHVAPEKNEKLFLGFKLAESYIVLLSATDIA